MNYRSTLKKKTIDSTCDIFFNFIKGQDIKFYELYRIIQKIKNYSMPWYGVVDEVTFFGVQFPMILFKN